MAAVTRISRALRFIVFNFIAWLFVVPFTLLVVLAWPFGYRASYFFARMWGRIVLSLARWICGLRFRVEGMENFPDQSCVIFVKHSSAFETMGAVALFPRSCWVLKRELLWVPFFGWTLLPLKAIAIDRSQGGQAVRQVVEQGKQRLSDGINVTVFPEGTRMPAGKTKRYGISGMLLAQEARTLIVPVAHNAGYYWRRRGFGIVPGEIVIVIGKPVDPSGREPRDMNQEIQDWIEAEVARIVAADGNHAGNHADRH